MELKDEINALINASVPPIAMVQNTVHSLPFGDPIAYRTQLLINSMDLGTLWYEQYSVTAERTKRAIVLAGRALTYAARLMEQYEQQNTAFDWLSVRCPDTILTKTDFPKTLRSLFAGKERFFRRLRVEFTPQLFFNPAPEAVASLETLHEMGIRIILNGFGDEYCPLTKLGDYPIDTVVLHPRVLELLQDPQREATGYAILAFVKGLRMELLAPPIEGKAEIALCEKIGCSAYTSAKTSENLLWEVGKWRK